MAEKDAQRKAERAKIVQITAGELEDLREQVRRLEAQVKGGPSKSAEKEIKKIHRAIEIGMTKEEVMAFVRRNSGTLEIVGIAADAGVQKATEQIVRKPEGVANRDVTETNGDSEGDSTRKRTKAKIDDDMKETVEVERSTGRRETITVARYGKFTEQTGSQRNSFGQSAAVYGNVTRRVGTIVVVLVDDVVTSVSAQ